MKVSIDHTLISWESPRRLESSMGWISFMVRDSSYSHYCGDLSAPRHT